MSPELIGLLGVVLLVVLIVLRMWIGTALAVVGFLGILLMRDWTQALSVLGSVPFQNVNNLTITVIPMFTLMGMIIGETNIGRDLFKAANAWIGSLRGGLASATVAACGMLGAITGSHYVGTVIMSKIALPEMRRYNYDDQLATASIAAGAPLSIIIPPSMPMIMYGIITEQPIGKLFMGGLLPGILMIVVFIAFITIYCARKPQMGPKGESTTWAVKFKSLVGIIPMLILFILVLGGIYGGFFTTTESGAVGALGALIIAIVTKQMNGKKFILIMKETLLTVCMVLFLLIGTYIFISFVSLSKLPFFISEFVTGLNAPNWVIVIALAIMYLILGMILPEIPMIVLTIPILFPALSAIGFDPVWLCIFVVLMMALGAITPPIGMVVFMMGGLSGVPVTKIFKGVTPFIVCDFIVIALVAIFPQIATFIPSMM